MRAGSGTMSHSTSITTEISARMTTSGPSQEEPPTGMTSENFSLPPLFSSKICELSPRKIKLMRGSLLIQPGKKRVT